MRRTSKVVILIALLASITIQADPIIQWGWDNATNYENGQIIGVTEILTTTLYCSDTPGNSGGPYNIAVALDDPGAPPSIEDMAPVVQGQAGTYACVATHTSSLYGEESGYSNEANFTVTAGDLGFVPRPPQNLTLQ